LICKGFSLISDSEVNRKLSKAILLKESFHTKESIIIHVNQKIRE